MVLLLSLLVACSGPAGGTDTDSGDLLPERAELSGIALDPHGELPVAGARVVVQQGEVFVTATTGADGTFAVPELLADTPLAVTVAAEGRVASTYAGVVLADEPVPLAFSVPRRHPVAAVEIPARITVDGVSAGSEICAFWAGIGGEHCVSSPGNDAVELAFAAQFPEARDPYGVFVAQRSVSTLAIERGMFVAIRVGDATRRVTLPADAPVELVVTTNQPEVADDPLDSFDPYYEDRAAVTHLGRHYVLGSTPLRTGTSVDVEVTDTSLVVTVPHVVVPGQQNRVQLMLSRTFATGHYAWADLPIETGARELAVTLLDGPEVETSPHVLGDTLTWDEVPDASDFQFRATVDGDAVWTVQTRQAELTLPTFPEAFDPALLFEGTARWELASRSRGGPDWGWGETHVDPMGWFWETVTAGGSLRWPAE